MQSPDESKPQTLAVTAQTLQPNIQLPKNAPFVCQDVRLRSRLYRTPAAETDRLCPFTSPSTTLYSGVIQVTYFNIEVDENTGCIDFVSNAKDDVSKIPQKNTFHY